MSKNILAVGGAGYVGSVLVPELIKRNHEVTVFDKLWFGNSLPEYVKVIEGDLFTLTPTDLCGLDTVIFLAGLSNDPMADWSPSDNFIFNGAGPAYLSYISKKAGVKRFIHGGSCSVYGNSSGATVSELGETNSNFPYGLSKILGEHIASLIIEETFSIINLRKGTVCGWSPRMRFDLIINAMMRDALTFGKINVNNAAIWRPILSIKDAARAYVAAVECGNRISGIFNVASGNYTVGEVATAVSKYILKNTGKVVEINYFNKDDKRDYRVSINKIRQTIGFEPTDSLNDIIDDVWKHWSQIKEPFNRIYSNIEMFKTL